MSRQIEQSSNHACIEQSSNHACIEQLCPDKDMHLFVSFTYINAKVHMGHVKLRTCTSLSSIDTMSGRQ